MTVAGALPAGGSALLDQVGGDNVTVINLRSGKHRVPLDQLAERLWQAMEGNLDTDG